MGIDVEIPPALAQMPVLAAHDGRRDRLEHRACGVVPPRPGIAKPELRQDVQRGRLRTAIIGRDPAQDVVFAGLGVIDEDIKITPRREGIAQGVDQLELGVGAVRGAGFPRTAGDKGIRPGGTCRASA